MSKHYCATHGEVLMHVIENPVSGDWICTVPAVAAWFEATTEQISGLTSRFKNALRVVGELAPPLPRNSLTIEARQLNDCIDFFTSLSNRREAEGRASLLRSPAVSITDLCNIKCTYCYVGSPNVTKHNRNELSVDTIKEFIDLAKDNGGTAVRTIQFFGGEPLVHPELPALISYARRQDLSVRISTNAVSQRLRSSALADATNDPGVHWRVSLDSHSATENDRYRGAGTYAAITKNLEYLKSRNAEVSIKCVMRSELLDSFNLYLDLARQYECGVTYTPLFEAGCAVDNGIRANVDEYQIVKRLLEILSRDISIAKLLNPSPFGFMIRSIYVQGALCVPRFTMYMHHDGRIYPMDSMVSKSFCIGEGQHLDLEKAVGIQQRYGLNGARCSECFAQSFCYVENSDSWEIPVLDDFHEFSSCHSKRSAIKLLMADPEFGREIATAMLA